MAGERLAEDRLITLAIETVTAVRVPRTDDVIAYLDGRYIATNSFDDSRSLVTQHDGKRIRQRALDRFEIGVTQACGPDTHQHVARLEVCHVERVDRQRRVDAVQNGGSELHDSRYPNDRSAVDCLQAARSGNACGSL